MTEHQDTETGTCVRCGRTLTASASIARGYGRTCGARIRAAADVADVAEFKDSAAALAKAEQLIEDAAIVPTRHAGQFIATSSDGTTVYLVDVVERSCTCKGYVRCGRCYHLLGADILTAAAPVRRAA